MIYKVNFFKRDLAKMAVLLMDIFIDFFSTLIYFKYTS